MAKQRTYPRCERDQLPMVKIDGRLQCAAEYLDRCLGLKRVVDLVQRDEVAYYVFEDGHELPLLCFCCGEPLRVFDLERSRRQMRGRRLERFSLAQVSPDGKRLLPQFRLEFSRRGLCSHGLVDPLSPEVAAGLRHPTNCHHQSDRPPAEKRRQKQR